MSMIGHNGGPRLELFPYQAQAADIMATRDRFGLHDEMGIGKTATSIGAADRLGAKRIVVVCPAMLRENWIKEFRKFSTIERRICKGENIHDFYAWQRRHFDVLVTSYELATKWRKRFDETGEPIDVMIFDEAHYMKNSAANRTKELLGEESNGDPTKGFGINCLLEWACHSYHVTGTPMANDPLDIFTFLRFAKAFDLSEREFVNTFYDRQLGAYKDKHTVKAEMVPVLQQLIFNNAIRRTHTDVGMQLPPIFMQEYLVDGDTKEITDLVMQYPGLEQVIINAIEDGGLSKLEVEHIAMLRRLVGKAKAAPYAQILKWELDQGAGKRVVFGIHSEPLEYLRNFLWKHGYEPVLAYGKTSERDRMAAVERFMTDPKCKVFLGNIKVAGVGLTLTESSEIDMFESDWSPAGNAQAIKRIHRIGQRSDVRARFITLAKSIDEAVNQVVAKKTAAIAMIEGTAMTAAPPLTWQSV